MSQIFTRANGSGFSHPFNYHFQKHSQLLSKIKATAGVSIFLVIPS